VFVVAWQRYEEATPVSKTPAQYHQGSQHGLSSGTIR
jgi:hypothetical protein